MKLNMKSIITPIIIRSFLFTNVVMGLLKNTIKKLNREKPTIILSVGYNQLKGFTHSKIASPILLKTSCLFDLFSLIFMV